MGRYGDRGSLRDLTLLGIDLTAHITEKPRPPIDVRPDIGRELNAIILRCLEKDPRTRYADAGALLADLDRVQMPSAAPFRETLSRPASLLTDFKISGGMEWFVRCV